MTTTIRTAIGGTWTIDRPSGYVRDDRGQQVRDSNGTPQVTAGSHVELACEYFDDMGRRADFCSTLNVAEVRELASALTRLAVAIDPTLLARHVAHSKPGSVDDARDWAVANGDTSRVLGALWLANGDSLHYMIVAQPDGSVEVAYKPPVVRDGAS